MKEHHSLYHDIAQFWTDFHIELKITFAWIVAFFPTSMIDVLTKSDPNPHVVKWVQLALLIATIGNIIYSLMIKIFGKKDKE